MKQLTGSDDFWFTIDTPCTPMHFAEVSIYDTTTTPSGSLAFEEIVQQIEARLDLLPLRQKQIEVPLHLDYPYLIEDEGFELDYHIRQFTLPRPGGWRQLCAALESIMAEPLDLSKPMWEMHVIDGIGKIEGLPEGSIAVLRKLHHAQFDGGSAVELTQLINTPTPGEPAHGAVQPWKPEKAPSSARLLARAGVNHLRKPVQSAKIVKQMLRPLAGSLKKTVSGRGDGALAPRSRFSARIPSAERVIDAREFSLPAIQQIRKQVAGATVNDVVLTICGGALRKYLAQHDELPDKPLVGMMPVSVRTPQEQGAGGNRVSAIFATLATDRGHPLERLKTIVQATIRSKEFADEVGLNKVTDLLDLAPTTLTPTLYRMFSKLGITGSMPQPYSGICISNVPGPRVPLFLDHARLTRLFAAGFLMDGMGLLHGVTGYCDRLSIAPVSHPALMPDMEFYAQCLQDAFDELAQA